MCGILGLIRRTYSIGTTEESNENIKNIFEKMLVGSLDRGEDSTGMFLMNKTYKASTEWEGSKKVGFIRSEPKAVLNKAPIPADQYINDDNYKKTIKELNKYTVSLVGHTRAATDGPSFDNRNNHPFLCGNILGVHNGVIYNFEDLAKQHNIKLEGECDSEIIFALTNHFMSKGANLKTAIQKTSKLLQGWAACALVDIRYPSKIALFRKDAPLSVRACESIPPTIAFASEDKTIKNAINGINKGSSGFDWFPWSVIHFDDFKGVIIDTEKELKEWIEKAEVFDIE